MAIRVERIGYVGGDHGDEAVITDCGHELFLDTAHAHSWGYVSNHPPVRNESSNRKESSQVTQESIVMSAS